MNKARTALSVSSAALAVVAVIGTGARPAATAARADPTDRSTVGTATFGDPQANPWFPLRPGTTTVLRGTDDGRHLREKVRVTHRTRLIRGVRTRAVRDVLR